MTNAVPAWTSSDGKIHTDYLKYLKYDLTLWLAKVSGNKVDAEKIVEAITKDSVDVLIGQITAISGELKKPSVFSVVRE